MGAILLDIELAPLWEEKPSTDGLKLSYALSVTSIVVQQLVVISW